MGQPVSARLPERWRIFWAAPSMPLPLASRHEVVPALDAGSRDRSSRGQRPGHGESCLEGLREGTRQGERGRTGSKGEARGEEDCLGSADSGRARRKGNSCRNKANRSPVPPFTRNSCEEGTLGAGAWIPDQAVPRRAV